MNSGMLGLPGILNPYIANTPYDTWYARLLAAGGSVTGRSQPTAYALWLAMSNRSYYSKIIYFLPFLGGNIAAATVPLIDTLAMGAAVNFNFVNGDFSETTGLQGDGTTKYLQTSIKSFNLNSNLGGLGFWIRTNTTGANTEVMGCNDSSPDLRISLDLRSNLRSLWWGNTSSSATACRASDTGTTVPGHFYGQKVASASRAIYLNGSLIVATTGSDTNIQVNGEYFQVMACPYNTTNFPWGGQGSCAYLTNGQLSASEVTDLHNDINNYLITALGR